MTRVLLIAALLFAGTAMWPQDPAKEPPPFIPSRYDSPNYHVSRARRNLGDLTIWLWQVAAAHPDNRVKYCSSWIEVRRLRRLEHRLYFAQQDPSDPPYGLFIAPMELLPDHLAVVKLGDGDGHLILIHKNGRVTDLDGGTFFLDREQQWLYSQHLSDVSGLTVYDLREDRVLFQTLAVPRAARWYRSGRDYLFTRLQMDGRTEDRDHVFLVRPREKEVVEQPASADFFSGLRPVHLDFAPAAEGACRFQT